MKATRIFTLIFMTAACVSGYAQKVISAKSPNGQTSVSVTLSDRIYYDVVSQNETLLKQSVIGMQLSDKTLGANPVLKKKSVSTIKETIKPIFPLKYNQIDNNYTLLTLDLKGGYAVDFQVIAYIVQAVLSGNGDWSQFHIHFLLSHLPKLLFPEFPVKYQHHRHSIQSFRSQYKRF